jgi:DNA polymerase (family 10)
VSDKQKFPHADALAVAEELQAMLAPACERIAIAGSLRRLKPFVSDAELLFVPRMSRRSVDMFLEEHVSAADEVCEKLLKDGVLAKRPNVNGHFAWGAANKLAVHVRTGIPVDLFSTNGPCWWVSLVIRTGSKETNLRLATGAIQRGASLMAYGHGIRWPDGSVTAARSERDVFSLCGVPYLENPKDR